MKRARHGNDGKRASLFAKLGGELAVDGSQRLIQGGIIGNF